MYNTVSLSNRAVVTPSSSSSSTLAMSFILTKVPSLSRTTKFSNSSTELKLVSVNNETRCWLFSLLPIVAMRLLARSAADTSSAAIPRATIFFVSNQIRIAGERAPSRPILCTPGIDARAGDTFLDK